MYLHPTLARQFLPRVGYFMPKQEEEAMSLFLTENTTAAKDRCEYTEHIPQGLIQFKTHPEVFQPSLSWWGV